MAQPKPKLNLDFEELRAWSFTEFSGTADDVVRTYMLTTAQQTLDFYKLISSSHSLNENYKKVQIQAILFNLG